ncbi:hypothetical protein [Methanolacinia paynteri]|uniref:hypothetical protein n=1 Tax=Methanolacinia paynteri TaxID=230356 RepID=UPI00064ECB8D|nr:hypothetical protein [Methanolacinia paynteri]
MPPVRLNAVKFQKAIIDRDILVRYLVVIDWPNERLGDIVKVSPTSEFNKYIAQMLNTYINKNQIPDMEVAPAIMNMADDYLTGNDIVLKAGDYYALQTHFRNMKKTAVKSTKTTAAATRKKTVAK